MATAKRIDVNIICAKCQKTVERREMVHDVPGGVYRYYVECHGEKDFGDHLTQTIGPEAHGKTLVAFPKYIAAPVQGDSAIPRPQVDQLPTNLSVEMKGRGTTEGGASPGPT